MEARETLLRRASQGATEFLISKYAVAASELSLLHFVCASIDNFIMRFSSMQVLFAEERD